MISTNAARARPPQRRNCLTIMGTSGRIETHTENFFLCSTFSPTAMKNKKELYTHNPTYSRPLPLNFTSKASDMAKGLFGLCLSLEEEKGSTELTRFMRCQVPLQGDNVQHPTSICMGERNPEDFGRITVAVSF